MLKANHVRHRNFVRLRHSGRFREFLAAQATRLGETTAQIFARLKAGASAADVRAVATPEG